MSLNRKHSTCAELAVWPVCAVILVGLWQLPAEAAGPADPADYVGTWDVFEYEWRFLKLHTSSDTYDMEIEARNGSFVVSVPDRGLTFNSAPLQDERLITEGQHPTLGRTTLDVVFNRKELTFKGTIKYLAQYPAKTISGKIAREILTRRVSTAGENARLLERKLVVSEDERRTMRVELERVYSARGTLRQKMRELQTRLIAEQRGAQAANERVMTFKTALSERDGRLEGLAEELETSQKELSAAREEIADLNERLEDGVPPPPGSCIPIETVRLLRNKFDAMVRKLEVTSAELEESKSNLVVWEARKEELDKNEARLDEAATEMVEKLKKCKSARQGE